MQIEGKRLLIAVPTRGYMGSFQWCNIANLMAYTKQWWEAEGGIFAAITDDRGHVVDSRTGFAEFALEEKVDWIFWLDDDAKPQDPTLIRKLWSCDKLWIAPIFFMRNPPHGHTVVEGFAEERDYYSRLADIYPPRVFKAKACGFHAMLMHINIYKRAKDQARIHLPKMREAIADVFPLGEYSKKEAYSPFLMLPPYTEDMTFCRFATMAGCQLWIDSRIEVPHVTNTMIDLQAHIYHLKKELAKEEA